MRLTKQTGHAIRILIDCARGGDQLVKTAEIARRLDITPQNVFKIVHLLAHAGFVKAVRGPNGGVRLARPAREIRIGDVVRAMEVTSVEVEPEGAPAADSTGLPINRVLDDALGAFIRVLDQHTLHDMAAGGVPDVTSPPPRTGRKSTRAERAGVSPLRRGDARR